jgi:hypothetical protein
MVSGKILPPVVTSSAMVIWQLVVVFLFFIC